MNDSKFVEQTNWELKAMKRADLIIMNFLPGSSSSISLLELGLFAESKKLMVCCPDEFDKSGHVHFICGAFQIPLFKKLYDLLININHAD